MLIEFDKLQENLVPKPRGGEGEMYTRTFQDENNKIMHQCDWQLRAYCKGFRNRSGCRRCSCG